MATSVLAISSYVIDNRVELQQELTYTEVTEPVETVTEIEPDLTNVEYVKQEILKVFPDAPIMVEVARCESNLDPKADRKGIDGGLFQINQIHSRELEKLGLDRYDLHDNLAYARKLYDQSGLGPWYMSQHCWS